MRHLPTLLLGVAAALAIAVPTASADVDAATWDAGASATAESSLVEDAIFGGVVEAAGLGLGNEAELSATELARSTTINGNSVRKVYTTPGISFSNPVVEGRSRLTISSTGVRASAAWSVTNRGSLSRIRTELVVYHNGRAIYTLRCSNATSCSAPNIAGRPAAVTAVSRFCANRDDDGRDVICTRSSTARLS